MPKKDKVMDFESLAVLKEIFQDVELLLVEKSVKKNVKVSATSSAGRIINRNNRIKITVKTLRELKENFFTDTDLPHQEVSTNDISSEMEVDDNTSNTGFADSFKDFSMETSVNITCVKKNSNAAAKKKYNHLSPSHTNPIKLSDLPWIEIPNKVRDSCANKETISFDLRNATIHALSKFVHRENDTSVSMCINVAALLCRNYPHTFSDRLHDKIVKDYPHISLYKSLYERARRDKEKLRREPNYIAPLLKNVEHPEVPSQDADVEEPEFSESRISTNQMAFLKRNLKSLEDFIDKNSSFIKIMNDWPCLKEKDVFFELIRIKYKEDKIFTFQNNLNKAYLSIIRVIKKEIATTEQSKSKKTRGSRKWDPKKLKICQEILEKIEPSTGERTGRFKQRVGAIELVAAYFNEDFGNILKIFDVSQNKFQSCNIIQLNFINLVICSILIHPTNLFWMKLLIWNRNWQALVS